MKRKRNKYKYLKVVQGNDGDGWQDMSEYENDPGQARRDLDHFRWVCPGRHRIISRREERHSH